VMIGMLPNATKSEVMLVGTRVQVSRFRQPTELSIAGNRVACKKSIWSLGVMLDPELSFGGRVDSIISSCNYHIRALRHIRTALSDDLAMTVGRAIVISRIDYCNSLLFNQSEFNMNHLQRLQNRLVRTVKQLPFRSHVSCVRESLHWLPARERIKFKMATLTYDQLVRGVPS